MEINFFKKYWKLITTKKQQHIENPPQKKIPSIIFNSYNAFPKY